MGTVESENRRPGLRRDGTLQGLILACVGASIGSGWLFGPLFTAKMAGPFAIGSWIIGMFAILLLAVVFAELAPLIPKAGAVVHLANVGNGPIVGNMWTWILFLSYATIAPIEVTALLTYANNYFPHFLQPHSALLSAQGYIYALIALAFFVGLNFLSVRWIFRINNGATWWKIGIPALTGILFIVFGWHSGNFHSIPKNTAGNIQEMFVAVATGGVIFSLLGFRHAIDLAGESKNPKRDLPLATIVSVLIAGGIYILVQVAFIGAVPTADLAHGGWEHLHFSGINGPFAALASTIGITWLALLLYADAFVSPAGTALIYTATSARVTLATAESGAFPKVLGKINGQGVPWTSLLLLYIVGAIFFLPFPSWQKMVGYIASMTVLSYVIGPVVLLQLRKAMPQLERPFTLPGAKIIAPISFVVGTWIVYWSGLHTLNFIFGTLFVLLGLYALWGWVRKDPISEMGWQHMWWIIPYFLAIWGTSWISPKSLGGMGLISFYEGMALIAVVSLVIFYWGVHSAVSDQEIRVYMRTLNKRGVGAP
ncbi:APC family permease [Acidithiobacillus sp.]|uniref:APC family permease n=1 Tax=Acidithiobacillus sp. TaxID=1872118 RepID=UPI0032AEB80E